jgi:serine-type D-Ala-D-Ala carboxypeptidase (penicillin-binding protein 5/6)
MPLSSRLVAVAVSGGLVGLAPLSPADAATPRAGAAHAAPGTAPVPDAARETAASSPSGVTAKGAYLYDANKGKKLWGRSTTTRRPMGSITKVMEALIVIRAGGLDRTVTVKRSWVQHVTHNDASSAGLHTGDRVTVRQLLYGALLPSGCDAAYGLADVYGTGQTRFVAKMNREAASLGMTHTHFIDADGLPTSSHKEGYSTPHDLMLLARTAMKSPTFRGVVARRTYRLARTSGHHAYTWTNTNLLLGSYSGAIGIKTGHTDGAGYCLLFAAKRSGRTLIGVLLDSTTTSANTRFTSAARLLDWGFGVRSARLTLRPLPAGAPTD